MTPKTSSTVLRARTLLTAACCLIIAAYVMLIDLKGINTDEGLRLAIINGGEPYTQNQLSTHATWKQVLATNSHWAYQPLYFLIQNSLMRVSGTHDVVFFRLVNVFFLWVSLQGLLVLSRGWQLFPRLFLLGLFGFNAYLFMHVLQIREYMAAVAFYIWSSWLVLRLDVRRLERPWMDAAWFSVYGGLLVLGFYVQSWVVFPAIGQGLFLIARRRPAPWRFLGLLAFSYTLVLAATLPYLLTHPQKIQVGRWGTTGSELWPQLSVGFHLVLAGHATGQFRFTDFLFWFWLTFILGTFVLFFRGKSAALPCENRGEVMRQGLLMLLCSGVSLAFQIGYFYGVENLSLWPRYFIIHYFFLTWLIALGFNHLRILRQAKGTSVWVRHGLSAATGIVAVTMLASAVFQVRSYYRDPFLDTGLSRSSNWQNLTAGASRIMRPADAFVFHDFISRSTFTFTRAPTNRVLLLEELPASALESVERLVYLESSESPAEKNQIAGRMATLGFKSCRVIPLQAADGQSPLNDWRAVAFSRP